MELELENVPKFDAEEYMPPEDDFRPVVLFYYGGGNVFARSVSGTNGRNLSREHVEKFIGSSREINNAAGAGHWSETDPEKKLRKLYARAQQIRNLSFERSAPRRKTRKNI